MPPALIENLLAALDIQCLYRKDKNQVTIWATLTDATPHAIAALLTDPRTGHETGTTTQPSPGTPAQPGTTQPIEGLAYGPIRQCRLA